MRVLITGGRNFSNRAQLFEALDRLNAIRGFTMLIHGDARGVDRLAAEWATQKGIQVKCRPADWRKYGRAAGLIQNEEMLKEKPDLVVAFPGGKGTADMVTKAKRAGIEVFQIDGDTPPAQVARLLDWTVGDGNGTKSQSELLMQVSDAAAVLDSDIISVSNPNLT